MQRFGQVKTRTATSGLTARQVALLVVAFLAGVILAVVGVQNGQSVTVKFLWLSAQQAPLVVVILLSVLAGFFGGALAVLVRRTRSS